MFHINYYYVCKRNILRNVQKATLLKFVTSMFV